MIPPSCCPWRKPDRTGPARDRCDTSASYTTRWDTTPTARRSSVTDGVACANWRCKQERLIGSAPSSCNFKPQTWRPHRRSPVAALWAGSLGPMRCWSGRIRCVAAQPASMATGIGVWVWAGFAAAAWGAVQFASSRNRLPARSSSTSRWYHVGPAQLKRWSPVRSAA